MYYKVLFLNNKLESRLKKLGFIPNSYKEVSSYYYVDGQVKESGCSITLPNDYKYDGSVWREVILISYYERYYCLERQPQLSFHELWELYISTSENDDEIGSLSIILDYYNKELLDVLTEYTKNKYIIDKKGRRKLSRIGEIIMKLSDSIYTDQILNALSILK